MEPAQQILMSHLQAPEFTSGAAEGWWGHVVDKRVVWPQVLLWIAAPEQPNAPDRFYVRLDFAGYPNQPPTGNVVDPDTWEPTPLTKRPKGQANSRFAKVMRVDWEGGRAFYHPFDRHATSSHTDWATNNPRKRWTPAHTVTHWLAEFHALFQSEEYVGV
ncbi:DUF7665 family protein [Metallibacterium scheffleri]|uniref:Uncharacterized protein n=1 Tax=Metallibacterium scheffleri TaxID=993689 RepID=A0A4S3KQS4_9GAMM|nr:hypothetical protein [Metallibacterium scheffleri]THD11266.1 hypothetical protein B1806_03870 [Metallibacterium scheffleri]